MGTEIISVASGKGGTGKTIILASLGYALQVSGHRVLFIDSDTATDGLSLFVLGPRGKDVKSSIRPENTLSDYLRAYLDWSPDKEWIVPFQANRGLKDDHGEIYDLLLSGRGLYGDLGSEINLPVVPQLTREAFRDALQKLFDWLRAAGQWDYVLIDTRGGFGFNTTDVCALSDSYFLVTEPDVTSFYQDKNLMLRLLAAADELNRKPSLRGIIVNKATEYSPADEGARVGVHSLDLNRIEASFRSLLADHFRIDLRDTHPVPLDIKVVDAYKVQRMPYVSYPGSMFSYATVVAFSSMMEKIRVGAQWTKENTKLWNSLVNRISEAIKDENRRAIESVRQQQELRVKLTTSEQENQFLKKQIEEERKVSELRIGSDIIRQRRQERFVLVTLGIVSLVVVSGALYSWQSQKAILEKQQVVLSGIMDDINTYTVPNLEGAINATEVCTANDQDLPSCKNHSREALKYAQEVRRQLDVIRGKISGVGGLPDKNSWRSVR
jgi:MinD-like ATPase involved in chromosome partitioning or flagellar assembly